MALDSWRGIAALFVAAFHVGPVGHLQDLSLLRQAYYFVDLFFVLSGFVIAANYGTRLTDLASVRGFLLLRLGRLYPLHFALFMAFLGLELLKFLPVFGNVIMQQPFSTPETAPETIFTNLLLVHSLGAHDFYTWNTPSWSISTEFYTYVLFAIALLVFRKRVVWFLSAVVLISPVALFGLHGSLAAGYDYGLIRCVFGFAAGVLAWRLYLICHRRWGEVPLPWMIASLLETVAVCLSILAISMTTVKDFSFVLPYLFALAIVLFAFEGGAVSQLLKHRWPIALGMLSYSVYMTHMLVKRLLLKAADVVERYSDIELVQNLPGTRVIGTELWQGDVYLLTYLCVVITLSFFTYRFIEQPARSWSRSLVLGRGPARQYAEGEA
ncbi:acyltransferase [Pelagibius litoralis]|uniref:Acyltransferase n=1 Tax=Pelagibius litoralis TaxID=374515 RepID=A0A967C6S2_9PROT|nr:acyltransferase [Pelagibius litoralis]NIA67617.1 acyltransferase [Pelagibius litoralis]